MKISIPELIDWPDTGEVQREAVLQRPPMPEGDFPGESRPNPKASKVYSSSFAFYHSVVNVLERRIAAICG